MLKFLVSFFVSLLFAPLIIFFAKKLKFGQNILSYVSEHSVKQGTPTMGGLIFILPVMALGLIFSFNTQNSLTILSIAVFFGFGLIGFLDDFIKIKFKRNLGLRPYQKIVFQLLLAGIVAVFVYRNNLIPNEIYIPFTYLKINLGWLVVPYVIFIFVATTNSVNLTDGLDGLAGGVSIVFFLFVFFVSNKYLNNFSVIFSSEYMTEVTNLNNLCLIMIGALLAYLIFNWYPAKIFMGDTGSLAIGGLIASVVSFNGLSLYIPIVGIMFVVSTLSVIIQVVSFKSRKKRVFLMAPFHHHLQQKGMHESKIVFIYIVITIIMGVVSLSFL